MVERRLKCLRPPVRVRHFLFRFCMEKKNKFGKEFTMEKRPLDTELEVLWSEHLEDDVFSVRAYNVLAHRLGLRTLGDILNLTRDDIAKARGAGKKTLDDIAKLVRSCGYELNGFTDAGPNCKSANRGISCGRRISTFSNWQGSSTARIIIPRTAPLCFQTGFPERRAGIL